MKIIAEIGSVHDGNLKFANTEHNLNNFLDENYLNKIKDRKIWCGASTHSSEEIICAKAHKVIRKNHESLLTIIIPRHIHRVKKIKSDLEKMNLKICLYSDFNKINDNIDILLVSNSKKCFSWWVIDKTWRTKSYRAIQAGL